MEHLLPHEVAERELEMQEAAEIEEHREEEAVGLGGVPRWGVLLGLPSPSRI